jgi:hypothetical protein
MLLPWSTEKDDLEKLNIGSMAKFTLASNASRDVALLRMLKRVQQHQPEDVKAALGEVVEAAETAEIARIRKDAMAAIDQLRNKGPQWRRDVATWGQAGELAVSAGCLGAAVAGQVALGLPCVVGGALTSAGLRYLTAP